MLIPDGLQALADEISGRLRQTSLQATDILSSGYDEQQWNGRYVLRLELHGASADGDLDYLERLAAATVNALADDDGRYDWDTFLGAHGVGHYLIDPSQLKTIVATASTLGQ